MERVRTLGDLREGKIPDSFCQRWPVLTKYIMKLTSKEPSVRPTATQLLQSELFCSKDIVIHGLQRKVEEQEEEIMELRRQISQLQSSQVTVHFSKTDKT
ncbi:Eukaryotic translation initiation factor 2-alpha kinase 1 [Larimichthys crocea]|nr:Eukaryotic translation initiation factor 2-alpha kinase 1 [Larimichthys crocea]